MELNKIVNADSIEGMKKLPANSIDCCITSPPYYGLRDYQVKGQYGLEKTPQQFVDNMVEVFNEVRRVLKPSGTLWINIGDSYATSGSGTSPNSGLAKLADKWAPRKNKRNEGRDAAGEVPRGQGKGIPAGIKPKDLIGIPWMLAFALRQPYYTGKIKRESDRIWLAAMIDGEGCIFIHKRKVGQSNGAGYLRKSDTYSPGLEICNTNKSIIDKIVSIVGLGSVCAVDKESKLKNRNKRLYRWNVRSNESKNIIAEVYPYLVGKQHEARLLYNCPTSGPDAEAAHASVIALHNGREATIDFKEPPTLYEPGWYLRQDIIWSKPNPMPESVVDRCTKAHEYIFLFSKSKRYYYDAEAIKEPASASTHERVARAAIGQKSNPDHATKNGIRPKKMGDTGSGIKNNDSFHEAMNEMPDIRNKRSVWSINPQAFPEAHFATFPEKLPMECIRAGSSEHGCCAKCGHPYTRILKPSDRYAEILGTGYHDHELDQEIGMAQARGRNHQNKMRDAGIYNAEYITMGWKATCKCDIGLISPSIILDPFMGAGTTALVARKAGRNFIGFELNPEYIKIAERRLSKELGMFI